MPTTEPSSPPPDATARPNDKAEHYGNLAVSFCRAGTLILIAQQFALPVIAGAAAFCFALALRHDNKNVRCFPKYPLFIITFWTIVCAVSLYLRLRPMFTH